MLAIVLEVHVDIIQYVCMRFYDTIDINKQDNDGYTALILAVQYDTNVIQLLCDNIQRYN